VEGILRALVELYAPVALGALYSIAAKPGEGFARALSRALLYSFLPLLLFTSTYGGGSGELLAELAQMGAAAAIAAAASLASSLALTRDGELALLSTYVNAGYLPIPVAQALWGERAVRLVGFYVLFNASLGYALAPLLLKGDLKGGLRELARFPPLYAVLSGLALSLAGVELPSFLVQAAARVGGAAPHLALFAVGLQLTRVRLESLRDAAKVAVVRFAIAPLAVALAAPRFTEVGSLAWRVAILESCMPPAVTGAVLCSVYSPCPERGASVVLLLTLASTAALPLLLALLA
jgi:predicted permease